MKNHQPATVTLLQKTYLELVKNSVGANSFKSLWALVGNEEKDVTQGGLLSCAYFVSSVLVIFGFIKRFHTTVERTLEDMKASGWYPVPKPKPGCILHWDASLPRWERQHLGFFVGQEKAVSNLDDQGSPQLHHWTYEGQRPVKAIYWNDKITEKLIF